MRKFIMMSVAAMLAATATPALAASLWASDSGNGSSSRLYELDSVTGAVLSSIAGPGLFADALSFANDGQSIFVLDSSTNSDVYRIDLAGNVLNNFDVALDAEGLTVLADGSLVIGGGTSGVIAFVNPNSGAILSSFAVTRDVFGLSSNGTDRLYGLTIDGDIITYDLAGNVLSTLVTPVAGTTLGLASNGAGGFFVSAIGSTIFELDAGGAILRSFAGPGPFTEGLDFPQGVQVGVPEPESWAMMIAGFGLIGGALRARRVRVAFAV